MQNINDCSIREYRSIVATIMGHQALSPGLNHWLSISIEGLFQLRMLI